MISESDNIDTEQFSSSCCGADDESNQENYISQMYCSHNSSNNKTTAVRNLILERDGDHSITVFNTTMPMLMTCTRRGHRRRSSLQRPVKKRILKPLNKYVLNGSFIDIQSHHTSIQYSSSDDDDYGNYNCISHSSSSDESLMTSAAPVENSPTELDKFLSLLQKETNSTISTPSNDIIHPKPLITRARRSDSYLQRFLLSHQSEEASRKFLTFDKKHNLHSGIVCIVLEKHITFGVHIVTVQKEIDNDNNDCLLRLLLDSVMAQQVKVGSKLEAFFDQNLPSYASGLKDDTPIYVKPYRLLLI